jgi:hypothetical protein
MAAQEGAIEAEVQAGDWEDITDLVLNATAEIPAGHTLRLPDLKLHEVLLSMEKRKSKLY